jgi:hypothetical protein
MWKRDWDVTREGDKNIGVNIYSDEVRKTPPGARRIVEIERSKTECRNIEWDP